MVRDTKDIIEKVFEEMVENEINYKIHIVSRSTYYRVRKEKLEMIDKLANYQAQIKLEKIKDL